MEFHDILHGHIVIDDREIADFLGDLLESPEVHRLRNMRQMNFDVPLIQELGRSRRLPHSIGVAHLAYRMSAGVNMHKSARKSLIAAALLHDAAIPPFGHLVESELKAIDSGFSHEHRLKNLIFGLDGKSNKYKEVVHGKSTELIKIFNKHGVNALDVLRLVCPVGRGNVISDGIDIDNIDNVHRMACMLGWHEARDNMHSLIESSSLSPGMELVFDPSARDSIASWMQYRSRIYTMIIGHPQCIAHNALQADISRLAVSAGLITSDDWQMTEPEFEQLLREDPRTSELAWQLISGCEYVLEDYVWFKNYSGPLKLSNREISRRFSAVAGAGPGYSIFVWNENGLISRRLNVKMTSGDLVELGESSRSCMVALVRTRRGKKANVQRKNAQWRRAVIDEFAELAKDEFVDASFPEEYSGEFRPASTGLKLGYH